MQETAGLQVNIDQFTVVFLKPNSGNWESDCEDLKEDLLDNSLLAFRDEIDTYGKLVAYNNVITLKVNGSDIKLGYNTESPNHGFCISFTSMAFRSLLQGLNLTAYSVYQDLYKIGLDNGYTAHLSRADLAIDLFNKDFTVDNIASRLDRKTIIIRDYRDRKNNSNISTISNNSITNTIYVGSHKKSFLRVYNKKQEQIDNQGSYLSLANSVDNWTRFEYVLRGNYCRGFAEKLLQVRDDVAFNSLILQTMTDRYRFTTPKGRLLSFSRLMLDNINVSTPVIFAPKTRLNNHDLIKRGDYYKSPKSGLIRFLRDLTDEQGKEEAAKFLEEVKIISGIS